MRRVHELSAEEVRTVIRESDTNTELSTARIAESDFRIQDTYKKYLVTQNRTSCFKTFILTTITIMHKKNSAFRSSTINFLFEAKHQVLEYLQPTLQV